jgi:hypothetical protein
LTAWSVAGVLGPVLVNRIRDHALANHASGVGVYASTMYLMAGLLVIGLICDLLIQPVAERHYHHEDGDGGASKLGVSASRATPYAPRASVS